eukprot:gene966-694_t
MATKLRQKLFQLKELAGLLMNSRQEVVQTQSAAYQALMGFQQFQADQWETSVNDLMASNEKLSQRCMEQQLVISALEQQLSSCQSTCSRQSLEIVLLKASLSNDRHHCSSCSTSLSLGGFHDASHGADGVQPPVEAPKKKPSD